MRKRSIGELGLVLLCTSLMLVATATAQGVSSAKDAAAAKAAQPVTKTKAPIGQQGTLPEQVQKPQSELKAIGTPSGALSTLAVKAFEKAEAAEKYGTAVEGGERACSDCLAPTAALGDIGPDVWGYSQAGNCGTEGKWYASFNGYAGLIYHFDLCPDTPGAGTASFDIDIKIVNASCAILAGVDGSCSVSNVYRPNDFQWTPPADGVYYVVLAPYRSYNQHSCTGTVSNTFTLAYYAEGDPCIGQYPANDTCEDLPTYYGGTIPTLTAGVTQNFFGDNTCARADCTQFPQRNAWEAFTLSGSATGWDITLDYCNTTPVFGNSWLNLMLACPCDGFTAAGTFDETTCIDGNVTIRWAGLADGTYYYPVMTDPANSAEGAYQINVVATVHVPTYCAASGGCDEYISRVQVGTIDNATACTGYGDYTAMSTDMIVGTGYPITVTIGNPYSSDKGALWIDWNRDLDFSDAGETIISTWSGVGPYTTTITPPLGTLPGPTRMRVRLSYSTVPPACGTTTYGEAEDYTVNVLPPAEEGACCVEGVCIGVMTQAACEGAPNYGTYKGDGSLCTPNPCIGACCFPDGSCTEVTSALACSGTYSGDGTNCSPNLCSQPGNDCLNPKPVTLSSATLPYTDADTTCGRLNDYADTCLGSYDGGEDILYALTVTEDMCVKIRVAGSSWVGVVIDTACPPGNPCLAYATTSGCCPAINAVNLTAGTYYLMIDTWPSPNCTDFTLTIETCPDPMTNDNCAGATAIGDVTNLPWDTSAATFDGLGTCMTSANIWYCYTATCTGDATISLCGSSFDTKLAVYDGCTCDPLGTQLACNDDSGPACSGLQSSAVVFVIAGQQYLIEVGGYSSNVGAGVLTTSCAAYPTGACCQATGCTVEYEVVCTNAGGIWAGPDTVCSLLDCNGNSVDDTCDILSGTSHDCNANGIPDECDIASGFSVDVDGNLVPDDCDPDCNGNSIPDACELPGGCATGDCGTVFAGLCGNSRDCQEDGIPDECQLGGGRPDLIVDGSFEGGTPSAAWTEFSTNFGTPLCDVASCGTGGGTAGPRTGGWWAWFGGANAYERGYVEQTVTIPSGGATLEFYLWNGSSGGASDYFSAKMDGNVVFTTLTGNPTYTGGYVLVSVDVSAYANGASHVVRLESEQFTATATNFSVDDVALNTGGGGPGADCNTNGIPDECDVPPICDGPECSQDCNENLIPDECEVALLDCNGNGRPDDCDIASGYSLDCNTNGIPDECELAGNDCNGNLIPDDCDLASGFSQDCNNNDIPDECDIANCDGSKWCRDCQLDGIPDGCQLYDAAAQPRETLQYDDGSSENSLGNQYYAHEICWIHHFTAANPGIISEIRTCFGTPAYPNSSGLTGGEEFRVFIWSDPNGDGDPTDAVLLAQEYGYVEVGSIDTDVLQSVAVPDTSVLGSFFIGASITGMGYEAALDEDGVLAHESWFCWSTTGTFDPANLGPTLNNLDVVGLPGNWMLRADIQYGAPPNDCNQNQIPDECDIGTQWGGYCVRLPSDPDGPCASDWNHDGIPDMCQICGDINADLVVDINDYYIFLDAFGTCLGDLKYDVRCDMDGDQCITLADYRAWRICYKMANGFDFMAPKVKKFTTPATNLGPTVDR